MLRADMPLTKGLVKMKELVFCNLYYALSILRVVSFLLVMLLLKIVKLGIEEDTNGGVLKWMKYTSWAAFTSAIITFVTPFAKSMLVTQEPVSLFAVVFTAIMMACELGVGVSTHLLYVYHVNQSYYSDDII